MLILFIFNRVRGRSIIDRSILDDKDHEIESSLSLRRASIPWVVLVILCLVTNLIPQVFDFLYNGFALPITIGAYPAPIKTRVFWQAYTLMLIATVVSMPFLTTSKEVLKRTFTGFKKRALRPVLAAAIFFAMAEVLNFSGWQIDPIGVWLNPIDPTSGLNPTNNMIFLLASMTAGLGLFYPVIAPFLGLLAGFVSGSETSAIAMFTKYHIESSTFIGANAMVVSASNGIGGGLASVLSPAKIQNAAAVIDEIGIEGKVIRYGLVVALLMTWATSILTMLQAFPLTPPILAIVTVMILIPLILGVFIYHRSHNNNSEDIQTSNNQLAE